MQFSIKRILQAFALNNLASIWYCVIATLIQIYLITRSIYRFTAYVALPWPNGQAPMNSINAYMLFIGASIILLPFFIVVTLIKIGNYSNDGRKVGIFDINRYSKHMLVDEECESSGVTTANDREEENDDCVPHQRRYLRALWKNSLPIAPFLHLLISFCFLMPRLITEAQLIRHGFLSKADIWKTDLDLFLAKYNGKRFTFFGLLRTIGESEHRSLFSESATIGQYFIRNSKSLSETFYELDESGHFSFEFANMIIALAVFTVRYPAVFWRAHKCFSAVFSLHLLLNAIQSIIAFGAFQVAFKIFVCDPTHLMLRFRESSSLTLMQLCACFFAYIIVLHVSSISLQIYGMQKYREYRYARTKYLQTKYQSATLHTYFCYLLAMIFFLALSFLIGPLFYEFVIVYCGSLSICALLVIFSTIIYFTCWIVLWAFLALKTTWTFDYDDFESDKFLLGKTGMLQDSPLLIVNNGKTYRVRDDIAKQAILGFVQNTLSVTQPGFDQDNCSNLYLDRSQANRISIRSEYAPQRRSLTKNSNTRYSTRSLRHNKSNNKTAKELPVFGNTSDSDGEYTTFQPMRRGNSFRQKTNNTFNFPAKANDNQFIIDMCEKKSNFLATNQEDMDEPGYGFTYMFNPLMSMGAESEPNSPTATSFGQDKSGSDTSSGIHSDGHSSSSASLGDKSNLAKSNSLESLMQTLQKLEAAAADKPKLRTLSSMQRSIDILNDLDQPPQASSSSAHVRLASFSSDNHKPIYGTRSKLLEFTQNPDYSKYSMPINGNHC